MRAGLETIISSTGTGITESNRRIISRLLRRKFDVTCIVHKDIPNIRRSKPTVRDNLLVTVDLICSVQASTSNYCWRNCLWQTSKAVLSHEELYTGKPKAFPIRRKFFGQAVFQLKPYNVKVLRVLFNLMTPSIVNTTERWSNPIITGQKITEWYIYIYITMLSPRFFLTIRNILSF